MIGGGFAGVSALRALPRGPRVTWLDARGSFEFLPNIHELVSGVKASADLCLPLAPLARRAGARLLRARVARIDPARRSIVTEGGRRLAYDALVLAVGGQDDARGVPGVAEHAHGFKSVAQARRIAARLAALERRPGGPHPVVVVGGGLEGVEVLGEILRRHTAPARLSITLVEGGDRLLPEAPEGVARHLAALGARDRVRFRLGVTVRAVRADRVLLGDGTALPSACTIWTGGTAPAPWLAACGLAPPGCWVPVRDTLQHASHPEIFVAGDAAAPPVSVARQAYHALDMGECAARNAAAWLAGRPLRAFRPSGKPMLVSFGDRTTVMVLGGRAVASPLLAGAKEAVYEWVMAGLDDRAAPQRAAAAAGRLWRAGTRLGAPALARLPSTCRAEPGAWLRVA